jgi:hypothetical protein
LLRKQGFQVEDKRRLEQLLAALVVRQSH